jgi:hypothetical protein
MTDDFIAPRAWIARERIVRDLRGIALSVGLDPELLEDAQRAADEDDDDAFFEAVAAFTRAAVQAKES